MALQIYALKRDFEVQKAERFFKERRVPYQFVDLKRHTMGLRELTAIKAQVGLRAMIDTTAKAYQAHYIRNLTGEGPILEALASAPQLLKAPIVRNGKLATVGYAPQVWAQWIEK